MKYLVFSILLILAATPMLGQRIPIPFPYPIIRIHRGGHLPRTLVTITVVPDSNRLREVKPHYPMDAAIDKVQAVIEIEAKVEENGRVTSIVYVTNTQPKYKQFQTEIDRVMRYWVYRQGRSYPLKVRFDFTLL